MKIRTRHVLALLMAAVMTFSAFSFSSFAAAPDEFDDIQTITSESFDVTILRDSHSMYYKFVPTQTGYYYITAEGVLQAYFTYYDDGFDEIGISYIGEYNDGFLLYFTADSTYYMEVSAYNESFPATISVNLRYMGTLDNAEIINLPYELTYIVGYNDGSYDVYGLEMSVAFSGGSIFHLFNYDIYDLFDLTCPIEHLGTNTLTLSVMGQYIASYDIELIENPVSSIEIVQAPYKEYYRYARDGSFEFEGWVNGCFYGWFEPNIDTEGLKVKINYTDGTSKTVEFNEDDDVDYFEDDGDGLYVDDYYMGVYSEAGYDCGDYNATVSYLGHEASFTIKVVDISLFEKLYVCATWLIGWMFIGWLDL